MGRLLALVSLMALLPTVAAMEPAETVQETVECALPPCGYILPFIEIEVEGKQPCGGGALIFSDGPPSDCALVMAEGESITYNGKLLWYWEVSEDGTYPKETQKDIVISFGSTSTNPSWIQVEVSGEGMNENGEYVITDQSLADPANYRTEGAEEGAPKAWFWFERDLEIKFTRTGSPNAAGLEDIDDRNGVRGFFVKAKSSDSGPRYKESFGVEEFRWNTCEDETIAPDVPACGTQPLNDSNDVPGIGWLAPLGLMVVIAARRRF